MLFLLFLGNASSVIAGDVVINEFQVEPSGSSQWVELYNKGSESVDLAGWIIDDNGGSTFFTIPSTVIGPSQCVTFSSGSFHLNTASKDGVRLLKNDVLIDSYDYEKSPGQNVSFGRSPDGEENWIEFFSPTKNNLNSNGGPCSAPSPTPTETMTPTPTKTPTPIKTPTPTKIPTPTRTPTLVKTQTIVSSPSSPALIARNTSNINSLLSPTSKQTSSKSAQPTAVLGVSDSQEKETEEVLVAGETDDEAMPLASPFVLFGMSGVMFLAICGILLYRKYRRKSLY